LNNDLFDAINSILGYKQCKLYENSELNEMIELNSKSSFKVEYIGQKNHDILLERIN